MYIGTFISSRGTMWGIIEGRYECGQIEFFPWGPWLPPGDFRQSQDSHAKHKDYVCSHVGYKSKFNLKLTIYKIKHIWKGPEIRTGFLEDGKPINLTEGKVIIKFKVNYYLTE